MIEPRPAEEEDVMQPFESHRPATLDEVLAVLGRSSPSKVLAGARDLFPELPLESFRACGLDGPKRRAVAAGDTPTNEG